MHLLIALNVNVSLTLPSLAVLDVLASQDQAGQDATVTIDQRESPWVLLRPPAVELNPRPPATRNMGHVCL